MLWAANTINLEQTKKHPSYKIIQHPTPGVATIAIFCTMVHSDRSRTDWNISADESSQYSRNTLMRLYFVYWNLTWVRAYKSTEVHFKNGPVSKTS